VDPVSRPLPVDEVGAEYFVDERDVLHTGEQLPPTYTDCHVTPLIDGAEYTAALRQALDLVGGGPTAQHNAGHLVLLAGWWLGLAGGALRTVQGPVRRRLGIADAVLCDGPPFCLDPWPGTGAVPFADPPDQASALLKILATKARAGVDVRVLGWVSPNATHGRLAKLVGAGHVIAVNGLTIRSVLRLRTVPTIGPKAVLNTVGHSVGACHSKVALVCDGQSCVAFTGGMDLEFGRWARLGHAGDEIWHDVVARVEGPAVQSIYDHFQELWEENLTRPPVTYRIDGVPVASRVSGTPPLPARVLPIAPANSRHQAQGLQTLPAARFRRLRIGPKSRPLRMAPNGLFTYRTALRKAILMAHRYVYIEDPLHWSQEVMTWLNHAVDSRPELRVIMLLSGVDDPNDPPLPHAAYRGHAVNHGLLAGLTQHQRSRVAAFRREGVVVHAKTVLVDDAWAVIGSCNIARRSLYTDIEHGLSFCDNEGELVRDYRDRLWAHHFRHDNPADFHCLAEALHAWSPEWGRPGKPPPRPPWLLPLALPLQEVPFGRRRRWLHASLHECDSRRPWNGLTASTHG